jgi:hypothetical protein
MKNLIGGLFPSQENANRAYEALQRAGFAAEELVMFVHRPRRATARSTDVRIQDVAKYAFWGGIVVGGIGALLGFLVGTGTLSHPFLEPGSVPRDPLFVFMSVMWGLIPGGLIGVILGAASRLLRSRERAEVMTEQIIKRGVLVTANVDGSQREGSARQVLEEHGATEVGTASEKWDPDAWWSPNENEFSLRNVLSTR